MGGGLSGEGDDGYRILAKADPEAAYSLIEQMLADQSDVAVRREAVAALRGIQPPTQRVSTLLQTALRDAEAGIRSSAASAFSHVRDPSAVPGLRVLLNDPSPTVRRHAARAIGDITGRRPDYN